MSPTGLRRCSDSSPESMRCRTGSKSPFFGIALSAKSFARSCAAAWRMTASVASCKATGFRARSLREFARAVGGNSIARGSSCLHGRDEGTSHARSSRHSGDKHTNQFHGASIARSVPAEPVIASPMIPRSLCCLVASLVVTNQFATV
jgi:hypothetical protein